MGCSGSTVYIVMPRQSSVASAAGAAGAAAVLVMFATASSTASAAATASGRRGLGSLVHVARSKPASLLAFQGGLGPNAVPAMAEGDCRQQHEKACRGGRRAGRERGAVAGATAQLRPFVTDERGVRPLMARSRSMCRESRDCSTRRQWHGQMAYSYGKARAEGSGWGSRSKGSALHTSTSSSSGGDGSESDATVTLSSEAQAIADQIAAVGLEIRAIKEGGSATKEVLKPHIDRLLELKGQYKEVTGESFDPKDKAKEEKEARKAAQKAEKEAKAAAKRAKQQQQQQQNDPLAKLLPVTYGARGVASPDQIVGDYATIASHNDPSGRTFSDLSTLGVEGGPQAGEEVWVRGRIYTVRGKGGSVFAVLRQGGGATLQAVCFKSKEDPEGSKMVIKYMGSLPVESVVDVQGTLVEADVKSCSQGNVELQISRAHCVSRAQPILPFLVDDAARSEAEVEASADTERPFPRLGQELRLDNRWLDLRTPANNAIMRVQSAVCQLFREALYKEGFMEIHTPKLLPGESEGGAGVFRTDYFGTTACLAQSPQLYKQMAISGDLDRVFEVGPVFRAENSHTRRHLCEFTGLDLEMAIGEHYEEVLVILHRAFKHMFEGLEERFSKELATIREQFASEPVLFTEEPCIVHWDDAMAWLREADMLEPGQEFDDLNGAQELKLGEIVREKFSADFFMLDRYPSAIRPFYTMPCPDDKRFSNSYDLFLRGQEICSGAQRCHDPALLRSILAEKEVPVEPLKDYIAAFESGCPPHGGAGIGLERVVFLYLGLDNVRKASMFPRDPNRLSP